MPLTDLLAVCPPPARPVNPPTAQQWGDFESLIGHALPPDYKAFLDCYGSGVFGVFTEDCSFFDLLFVVSPGQPPDKHDLNAIPLMSELTTTIGDINAKWPETVPAPAWPAPGGLLYVGGTTTTHSIYWKTDGAETSWTCMISDYGCDNWFAWEGDLTSLLAAIVTGRVPEWIIEGAPRTPLVFVDLDTASRARLT